MNLPKKDKHGNSYLSYSQIRLFKSDPKKYKETYIENKPFLSNEYIDFGNKVGSALEKNDFSKFSCSERETLMKVTRLDEFERRVKLNYDDFYVIGYIDTNTSDLLEIIDYKTGGLKKEYEYKKDDYTQLCLYALGIRQETGITPHRASVEFIRRSGNAYRGQTLKVAQEDPISIKVDISEQRLKRVYWQTLSIAKEIESFYEASLR